MSKKSSDIDKTPTFFLGFCSQLLQSQRFLKFTMLEIGIKTCTYTYIKWSFNNLFSDTNIVLTYLKWNKGSSNFLRKIVPSIAMFPQYQCDSKFWVICCKITADNWGNILMLVLSIYLPYAHIFSQMEPLCCYLKGIQLMSTLLFVKFYITSKTKEMSYLIQMPSWENISHLSEQLRASCCSATSTISE